MINKSMKQEIIKILNETTKRKRTKQLTVEMKNYLETLFPNKSFQYQCDLLLMDTLPSCPICGNIPNLGKITCSPECREELKKQNGESSIEKMKASLKEKYGVDNPAKLKEVQEKRIQTIRDQNNGKGASELTIQKARERAESFNLKAKETIKNRYGVENASQIPGHRVRCKNTLLQNYGVESYFESDEWHNQQYDRRMKKLDDVISHIGQIIDIESPSTDLTSSYDNPNLRIRYQCKSCFSDTLLPTETFKYRIRKFGNPCSTCLGVDQSGTSIAENQIAEFLKTIYTEEIVRNSRTIIAPKEIDIFLPDVNLAIEYCGLFWHDEDRVGKKYHLEKLQKCRDRNIQLITIFEDEWIHRPDVVKSRLQSKLGKSSVRIGARKCHVKEISSQDARQFIETHHIQGYQNASARYGLFYKSKLVACMTFVKSNIAKKQSGWELSRFCIAPEISISGAASKLFSSFIKDYQPDTVTTFSDLRWNKGDVYPKLGFEFVQETSPGYWYIEGNKRIHRYALRKTQTDPKNISESLLRKSEGWRRIWDCGHAKYVWQADK